MGRARTRSAPVISEGLEFEEGEIAIDEDEAGIGDLSDFDSPEFADWEWTIYRLRSAAQMQEAGTRNPRVWVNKKVGPISLDQIQQEHGGGWYEFWGKVNGQLRKKYRREIEGPPKIKTFAAPAPVTANGHGEVNGNGPVRAPKRTSFRRMMRTIHRLQTASEERTLRMMEKAEERNQRMLELLIANQPKPQAAGLTEMIQGMVALKGMTAPDASGDPVAMARLGLDYLRQGIVIGEGRPLPEGGNDDGAGPAWVEKGLELLNTFIQRMPQRRAGGPPPRPASSATVVEEPRPGQAKGSPPQTPPEGAHHRMRAAIETVQRGSLMGEDPVAKARTIEDLLEGTEELANLRGVQVAGVWRPTVDEVLEWIRANLGTYQNLETPGGKNYFGLVLNAIRTPDEEDETES